MALIAKNAYQPYISGIIICWFHEHFAHIELISVIAKQPNIAGFLIALRLEGRAPAALCYGAVSYLSRAPFGLALQGVRDNPRRMAALGFNVNAHRVAAYAFASFLAGLGGVLQVWNYRQISPGSVGVERAIDILIIAIVGGITRPIGPFIGALIFVLLRTFTLDFLVAIGLDGNRFRLLIGLGFLVIVLFSPDGVVGLWEPWRSRDETGSAQSGGDRRHG